MAEDIDTAVTVHLTLAQVNEMHCFLTTAVEWYEEHGYLASANSVRRFKTMLREQVPQERITAAFAPLVRQYIEKEEANAAV